MAETLVTGRIGQVYVGAESPYGTAPTLLASHAVRHLAFKPSGSNFNRVNGPEKKQSPGVVSRFDRRSKVGWSLETLLRPSGTINTLPEIAAILAGGLGAPANTALSTTFTGTPTTTTGTVASATGLAKNQAVLITVSGVKYVRFLTNVSGSDLTWAPALPGAPAAGGALKNACTWKPASAITASLALAHYLTSDTTHSKIIKGAVVERLGFSFPQNDDLKFTASGPAKSRTTPAPSKPAGFTAVGTQNPPSSLAGELYVGAALYKHIKSDLEIQTGVRLRENSFGASSPEEILLTDRRIVTLGLDALVADESVIYDPAEAGTRVAVMKQVGFTEGNIVAYYAPAVDFEIPDQDDPDDAPIWPFKGICCESADGQNDEVLIAFC